MRDELAEAPAFFASPLFPHPSSFRSSLPFPFPASFPSAILRANGGLKMQLWSTNRRKIMSGAPLSGGLVVMAELKAHNLNWLEG